MCDVSVISCVQQSLRIGRAGRRRADRRRVPDGHAMRRSRRNAFEQCAFEQLGLVDEDVVAAAREHPADLRWRRIIHAVASMAYKCDLHAIAAVASMA